jgi:proliferating cell nuclear antigen PCNA
MSKGTATSTSDVIVEFRTNQIRPFKSLFDSIKNNLPDTSIFFDQTGMKIMQVDALKTFLVNVRLEGENFEYYHCASEAETGMPMVELNLSTLHLNQTFKSTSNDDNILRFVYEKNSDTVQIIISSDKKLEERVYDIPIQNPDENVQIGEISGVSNFPYSLTMPCADLQRICRDFKNLNSDKISITHDGSNLKFSCLGTIKSTINRRGKTEKSDDSVHFTKTPVDSTYSDVFKFSTLNEFSKCQAGGESKIVRILLKQGEPIVLHFEIGTLGEMSVAIAPHIDDALCL